MTRRDRTQGRAIDSRCSEHRTRSSPSSSSGRRAARPLPRRQARSSSTPPSAVTAPIGKRLRVHTMVSNFAPARRGQRLRVPERQRGPAVHQIDGPGEAAQRPAQAADAQDAHQRAIQAGSSGSTRTTPSSGLDPTLYHVEDLLTTKARAETLPLWKEVVDTYVGLGCKALFLRAIDPFGFADRTRQRARVPARLLHAVLSPRGRLHDRAQQAGRADPRALRQHLPDKILRGEDPNSSTSAALRGRASAPLAYNYDGKVFTCDEGRMLHEMGDDTFLLGDVHSSSFAPTSSATVSCAPWPSPPTLDGQPDCVHCTYQLLLRHDPSALATRARARSSAACARATSARCTKGIKDYLLRSSPRPDPADPGDLSTAGLPSAAATHFVQLAP